jgi:hypothetical protein
MKSALKVQCPQRFTRAGSAPRRPPTHSRAGVFDVVPGRAGVRGKRIQDVALCAATLCENRLDPCPGRSASHFAALSVVMFDDMINARPPGFNFNPRLPYRSARHRSRRHTPSRCRPRCGSSQRRHPRTVARTIPHPTAGTKAWNLCQIATVKCRWTGLCLSCGTSLERIAPESLTRHLYNFVHGHIWARTSTCPLDGVFARFVYRHRYRSALTARRHGRCAGPDLLAVASNGRRPTRSIWRSGDTTRTGSPA